MKIEWTDDDVEAAWKRVRGACDGLTNAIMDYAVESFLARVVGQAANDVRLLRGVLDDKGMGGPDDEAMRALSRLSALAQEAESLRAKVEELGQESGLFERHLYAARDERDSARVEVGRLKDEVEAERNSHDLARKALHRAIADVNSADSRLAAIRERAKQTMALVAAYKTGRHFTEGISMAGLQAVASWVLEGDAHNAPKIPDGSPQCPENTRDGLTCKSDAPVTPAGAIFAEMARPKRYPCSHTCTRDDAATPGHSERIKKRDLAVKAALLNGDAYERGAEAMRAACSEAVKAALLSYGFHDTGTVAQSVKAAIDGAKP